MRWKSSVIAVLLFVSFATNLLAADVQGNLKWASGKPAANQEVYIRFSSYNNQTVKTDADGNFTIHWSAGGSDARAEIEIIYDGKKVFEGMVKNGERVSLTARS